MIDFKNKMMKKTKTKHHLCQQDIARPLVLDLVDVGHFRTDVALVQVQVPVVRVDLVVSRDVVPERLGIGRP